MELHATKVLQTQFNIALVNNLKIVICGDMLETIQEKISELEALQNIRIWYCCESGSRAWGFASPDSDFDVRFIYARNQESYLSIAEIRDVVDLPVNEILDIGGWDIKKALKLFLKSNAPLYEWLQSPIVYRDNVGFADELRQIMPKYFSLRAGANHYLSMAHNTLTEDLQGGEVKLKRYFYALRPALACKWIIEKQDVPPMEFKQLRELVGNNTIQNEIDDLLKLKAASNEKTFIPPVFSLNTWLGDLLSYCKEQAPHLPAKHMETNELDGIFRKYISL